MAIVNKRRSSSRQKRRTLLPMKLPDVKSRRGESRDSVRFLNVSTSWPRGGLAGIRCTTTFGILRITGHCWGLSRDDTTTYVVLCASRKARSGDPRPALRDERAFACCICSDKNCRTATCWSLGSHNEGFARQRKNLAGDARGNRESAIEGLGCRGSSDAYEDWIKLFSFLDTCK